MRSWAILTGKGWAEDSTDGSAEHVRVEWQTGYGVWFGEGPGAMLGQSDRVSAAGSYVGCCMRCSEATQRSVWLWSRMRNVFTMKS